MISPQELDAARACAGGSPTAQIEHAHIFRPTDGSEQTSREIAVFLSPTPKGPGKRYIKNPELTNPPMI